MCDEREQIQKNDSVLSINIWTEFTRTISISEELSRLLDYMGG